LKKEHFRKMNGYSNEFWGWGGEDEDAYQRAANVNLTPDNANDEIGRLVRNNCVCF